MVMQPLFGSAGADRLAPKTHAVEVARRQATGDRLVSPPIKERTCGGARKGAGWLFFAGIMIFIAGVLNCVWGIAAIDDARFFVEDQRFILSDLDAWGWITLLIGVIQLIAAVSIWTGGEFGRWVGILRGEHQRDRRPARDARLPALVARHLRRGHPDHLRTCHLRRPPLPRQLRGTGRAPGPARRVAVAH